jgi:hypothetical protein
MPSCDTNKNTNTSKRSSAKPHAADYAFVPMPLRSRNISKRTLPPVNRARKTRHHFVSLIWIGRRGILGAIDDIANLQIGLWRQSVCASLSAIFLQYECNNINVNFAGKRATIASWHGALNELVKLLSCMFCPTRVERSAGKSWCQLPRQMITMTGRAARHVIFASRISLHLCEGSCCSNLCSGNRAPQRARSCCNKSPNPE